MQFEVVDGDLDVRPQENVAQTVVDQVEVEGVRMVEVVAADVSSILRPSEIMMRMRPGLRERPVKGVHRDQRTVSHPHLLHYQRSS